MVFFYHYSLVFTDDNSIKNPISRLFGMGWTGVDLFFVLSGFLITSILYETKKSDNYFINFYARRILRIFPLYYTTLFIIFIILPLWPSNVTRFLIINTKYEFYFWTYLTNYISAYKTDCFFGYIVHFWSLAIEEQFYLLWPLIIFLFRRNTIILICAISLVLSPILRFTLLFLNVIPTTIYFLTPCRIDGLALGAMIALLAHSERGLNQLLHIITRKRVFLSVLILGGFFFYLGRLSHLNLFVQIIGYSFINLTFGGILILALSLNENSNTKKILSSNFLTSFGKYSYSIYIFHYILCPVILKLFTPIIHVLNNLFLSNAIGFFLYLSVSLAICYIVSFITWHLYEKQFLKLKKYFAYK